MLYGYACPSTLDLDVEPQLAALKQAGCNHITVEENSTTPLARPALSALLTTLSRGDVLVVWRLDRLARSLVPLVDLLASLGERGIGLRSLSEAIDTTAGTYSGFFELMAIMAEAERAMLVERTQAGLQTAKRKGQRLGRQRKLSALQIDHAKDLLQAGHSGGSVARTFGISRATLYRRVKAAAV